MTKSPIPDGEFEVKYHLVGEQVSEDIFREIMGQSFLPQAVDNSGAPVVAMVTEISQVDTTDLEVELVDRNGDPPENLNSYYMVVNAYGNRFTSEFSLADGRAIAGFTMGGWNDWAIKDIENPPSDLPHIQLANDGFELASDYVRNVGWFPSPVANHTSAHMIYEIVPTSPPPDKYKIVLDYNTDLGTVELTPDLDSYIPGEEIHVKAIAADNAIFILFTGDINTDRSEFIFTMADRDMFIAATFREIEVDPDVEAALEWLEKLRVTLELAEAYRPSAVEALGG